MALGELGLPMLVRAHRLRLHVKPMPASTAGARGLGSLQLFPEKNSHAGLRVLQMVRVTRVALEGCPAQGRCMEAGIKRAPREGSCPPLAPEGKHCSSGPGCPPSVLLR